MSRFALYRTSDGVVLSFGDAPAETFAVQAGAGQAVLAIDTIPVSGAWAVSGGALVPATEIDLPVPILKKRAAAAINTAAEAARGNFITLGAGQALEYVETEKEARAYMAAGYPAFVATDWPYINAELQARRDAGETTLTATTATNDILAQADAWRTAGAAIKRLRRRALIAIGAATTAAQVAAAATVTWPSP